MFKCSLGFEMVSGLSKDKGSFLKSVIWRLLFKIRLKLFKLFEEAYLKSVIIFYLKLDKKVVFYSAGINSEKRVTDLLKKTKKQSVKEPITK